MEFPQNVKYARSHEWVRVEGNTAFVGISDFAQSELGDIVFVDITAMGDMLGAGDAFGTIEAVKTVSDLYLPITGEVVEINQKIVDSPETINRDPYGDGWMVRIAVPDGVSTDHLMDAKEYAAMVGH